MDFLSANTDFLMTDKGSWFYAFHDGEGEPAAFRADMDALPIPETIGLPYASRTEGISHKCGHDGHMAALCGAAMQMDRMWKERSLKLRPVFLIFQPGEEIGAGAKLCCGLSAEKGIREIYAFHNLGGYPESSIVVRRGLSQPASEGLTIHFDGVCSHASAPEKGKNPAAAIAQTALYASGKGCTAEGKLRLCTVVGMRCGERDFGISAGSGELCLTLRAERESEMLAMEEKLREFAAKEAGKYGLKVSYQVQDRFPETVNTNSCVEQVRNAARQMKLDLIDMKELWRASEDFGYYTRCCPGAIFYVGTGRNYPPLHTPEYDFNDRILPTATDMFVRLAISGK